MIEALRSGIASRSVGEYFSSSRGDLLDSISDSLLKVREEGTSASRIILGNYGEGKTHLLNTIASMAVSSGMAVSLISISKEAPANNLSLLYTKLIENIWLPGQIQPGFMHRLENIQQNSEKAKSILLSAATELNTDRLYYVFKDYLASRDSDENSIFENDIRGILATQGQIRQVYARHYGEKPVFKTKFERPVHFFDYYAFISHVLKAIGCTGWVILFDEAELIGRLGRKSRFRAYQNMAKFLNPPKSLSSVYTVYAFASSFLEDVITGRDEYGYLELSQESDDVKAQISAVLDRIINGDVLAKLTEEELRSSIEDIAELYKAAFSTLEVNYDDLYRVASSSGFLLRTKVRSAIEYLDQMLQYGDPGMISTQSLTEQNLKEDDCLKNLFKE